ncbi:ribosome recycling factor [Candidatus Dojkabacteria bacterium]|uniref:Ribosome-recycling factor n=1 Tax=Candidatus Dojkabacteria bacterium TaxID=2099670 RepID=A0A955RJ77_9BACT|nr:ribosome recycling factor [Candidatus Dojkabacteria bacterium]
MRIKFEQAGEKFTGAIDHLKKELASIRVGGGGTNLVDGIMVDAYGSKMPINQLANVVAVDATLITVSPWDKSLTEEIIKAITAANIGINPNQDGDMIRLPLPPVTEERRVEYVKLMKTKLEEARIAVRQIRKDILVGLEMDKKDKLISEDQYNSMEKTLQGKVEDTNKAIEEIGKDKEEELMKV